MVKRLGVVFTGGTLGSVVNSGVVQEPGSDIWNEISVAALVADAGFGGSVEVRQPFVQHSENVTWGDLVVLAESVLSLAAEVDAVIVLCGTDTLVDAATFFSFVSHQPFTVTPLGKPVVFTGANIPVLTPSSDASNNIAGAVGAASTLPPGVYVSFSGEPFGASTVLMPERSMKVLSAETFRSAGAPSVATVDAFGGADVDSMWLSLISQSSNCGPFDDYRGDYPDVEDKKFFSTLTFNEDTKRRVSETNFVLVPSSAGSKYGHWLDVLRSVDPESLVVQLETFTTGTVSTFPGGMLDVARWCKDNGVCCSATLPFPLMFGQRTSSYVSSQALNSNCVVLPTMLRHAAATKSVLVSALLRSQQSAISEVGSAASAAADADLLRRFRILMGTPFRFEFNSFPDL